MVQLWDVCMISQTPIAWQAWLWQSCTAAYFVAVFIPSQLSLSQAILKHNGWLTNIAIENGHRNSGISHEKWWFSIAMLNYQRVTVGWLADFFVKLIWRKVQDVLWKIFRFPAHSTPIAFLGIRVLPRVLSYWSPLCLTCFEILSESKFGFQSKGNFLQENAAL